MGEMTYFDDKLSQRLRVCPSLLTVLQILVNNTLVDRHPDNIWRLHYFPGSQFYNPFTKGNVLHDVEASEKTQKIISLPEINFTTRDRF